MTAVFDDSQMRVRNSLCHELVILDRAYTVLFAAHD